MNFSHKSLRFLIEAVEYRTDWYRRRLSDKNLSDDQRSELTNDHAYFCILLDEMRGAEAAERGGQ
jgi:hypothetical protein